MSAEILQGPGCCRITLRPEGAGVSLGFDAEGSQAWVSFPVGLQVHKDRGAALSAAARQIRAGLSNRITPAVTAWLASFETERQPDLFAA